MKLESFINDTSSLSELSLILTIKMSVDVFGRQLMSSRNKIKNIVGGVGSRGPPGNGFKFTADGQYDIDNRRLCNVADAKEENDAVSVKIMKNLIQEQLRLVYKITSSLRHDVDDLDEMIRGQEKNVGKQLKQQHENFVTLQELVTRNAQIIVHLEDRLRTLEQSGDNEEDNKPLVESFESRVKDQLKRVVEDGETRQTLTVRNSEIIALLDERLRTLENGRA